MKRYAGWLMASVLCLGCSDDDEILSPISSAGTHGNSGGAKSGSAGSSATATQTVAGRATTAAGAGGSGGGVAYTSISGSGGALSSSGGASTSGGALTSGGASTSGGTVATGGTPGSGGTVAIGGSVSNPTSGGNPSGGAAQSTLGGAAALGGSVSQSGETGFGGSTAAGAAGMAGVAGSTGVVVNGPGCGAVRDSVVGWWLLDGDLTSELDAGASLTAMPNGVAPTYVNGIASGQALDVSSGAYAETDGSAFNIKGALTLSAFVRGELAGRIIDHISVGGADGYLLDFNEGHLRAIVGPRILTSDDTYTSLGAFTHVAAVFTGGASPEIDLYLNGSLVGHGHVPSGEIPSNALPLRIGMAQDGSNRFAGQIDEPMVFSRALSADEIASLRTQLSNGECPVPVARSPKLGILLEHDAAGTVQGGDLEHLHSNIRRVGDLRVLADNALYSCDWNYVGNGLVACQTWAPFRVETKPGNYFAPVVPLEWQLYKLNSTGLVSGITRVIESNAGTSPATSNTAMTWFGRDWRTTAYATDVSGNAVLGSLTALTEAVGAGAPMGAYLKDWKYGLPRFTYLVPLSSGHVSGLDPWHISTDSTGAGELLFQSNSYHFGFWLDTSGYSYALRWDFGSSSLGSDWTEMLASTFAFEPSWTEVLAHDGTGVVSKGSIDALRAAVNAGAPIRVATAEGHFDCQRVVASTQLACAVGDAYTPVETASNHIEYDSGRSRRLRYFTTEGRVLGEAWADHSTNLLGSVDDHTALRWFAQRDGWRLTFQTTSSGSV